MNTSRRPLDYSHSFSAAFHSLLKILLDTCSAISASLSIWFLPTPNYKPSKRRAQPRHAQYAVRQRIAGCTGRAGETDSEHDGD
jgi:hypothetical protein